MKWNKIVYLKISIYHFYSSKNYHPKKILLNFFMFSVFFFTSWIHIFGSFQPFHLTKVTGNIQRCIANAIKSTVKSDTGAVQMMSSMMELY